MTEFYQLGQFLKLHRTKSGFTQAELADELGNLHTQFVSNWERGLCAPPAHCFQKLIEILNLNREDLVQVMLSDSKKMIKEKVFTKPKKEKKVV